MVVVWNAVTSGLFPCLCCLMNMAAVGSDL